jgi:hypothetical protein
VLPFPLSSARNGYPGTRMNTRTRVPVLIPGYPDPLCYPNSKKFFLMDFLQGRRNRLPSQGQFETFQCGRLGFSF